MNDQRKTLQLALDFDVQKKAESLMTELRETAGQKQENKEWNERDVKRFIRLLAWAIAGPIVIPHGTGWAEDIPQWLKHVIPLERMLIIRELVKEPWYGHNYWTEKVEDSEAHALAHMYPISMVAPIDHDAVNVYLYLATRVVERWKPDVRVPEDVRVDELKGYTELDLLVGLRRWLFRKTYVEVKV